MSSPAYAPIAVPAGAPPAKVAMHLQQKQGDKCCGCWCDYRRAVIIIAIVFLLFNIVALVISVSAFAIPGDELGVDDDEVLELWDKGLRNRAILSGVALFSSACALAGARQYNVYLVAVNIVWIAANYITYVVINLNTINEVNQIGQEHDDFIPIAPSIGSYVIEALFALLFIYPHAGFIHEVNQGIMSAETYPREEYSCCCV